MAENERNPPLPVLTRSVAYPRDFQHLPNYEILTPYYCLDTGSYLNRTCYGAKYAGNLLWHGSQQLMMALNGGVCTFNDVNQTTQSIITGFEPRSLITSMVLVPKTNYLALGLDDSRIIIWDLQAQEEVSTLDCHQFPVTSMDAYQGVLASSSTDIVFHDLREKCGAAAINHGAHGNQPIMQLKWSPDMDNVIATTGEDLNLKVWDVRTMFKNFWNRSNERNIVPASYNKPKPIKVYTHRNMIRALEWHPWRRGILSSGAGEHEANVNFWDVQKNVQNQPPFRTLNTGNELNGLCWSTFPGTDNLLVIHGTKNTQMTLWVPPSQPIPGDRQDDNYIVRDMAAECICAVGTAIVSTARSPNQSVVATISVDGFVNFWQIFGNIRETNDDTVNDEMRWDVQTPIPQM